MRPLSDVEWAATRRWVIQLSSLVRFRRPDIDTWITGALVPKDVVAGAIVAAIVRKLINPEGKLQESVDDYAYRRADAVADGSLYISESDWALLRPTAAPAQRKRAVRLVAYGDYP